MPTDSTEYAQIAAVAANFAAAGEQPGIAYGVVAGGELVHSAGLGERVLGGAVPDADTVFRIASMSKSFTASAILSLRDEGRLALDDLAAGYVPELRGWTPMTPDAEPVTIRHLLTMTAGFPTDDPWGDRQQGLQLDDFGKLLAGGVSSGWAPGTRFEYSNLGYAILGRVISEVTGLPYAEVIRDRLLRPLGMTSTGFEASEFADGAVARGYRRGPAGWQELPFDPYGAFAPMGGIFSTVRDLARWAAGFAAAFPPRGERDDHPVSRASRREMQLARVLMTGGKGGAMSYGYGLFVTEDPVWGRIVSHSGGYPGFGSNMRWHPPTGIGVIALGNSTYAPMTQLAGLLLEAALRRSRARPGVALAPGREPWPETIAAQEAVNRLLDDWDDTAADDLFAGNVALDAPYAERRHLVGLIRERIGDFAEDSGRPGESDTPAHRRWWLTGDRGTVQVQILLSPQRPPRVQSLTIAVPPAVDSGLYRTISSLVMWMNSGERHWPTDLLVAAGTEVAPLARRLRMAAIWTGRCRLGAWRAGDGNSAATVELAGEDATLRLTVVIDPSGAVRQATVAGVPR